MIPELAYELTTIPRPSTPATRLALLPSVEGNNVELPFEDHALAKCFVSMEPGDDEPETRKAVTALMDPALRRAKTMRIALKCRYVVPVFDGEDEVAFASKVAFWGPIRRPQFDYDEGLITINAVGPTARLEKAFIVAGDVAIDPGITLDGRGLRQLLYLAQNRPNQDDLDWPSLGIVPGLDTATVSEQLATLRRFDQIWSEGFVNLAEAIIAPDWEVEFTETDPSAIATGAVTDATDHAVAAVTTVDLVSTLPGEIGKLRTGLYLEATRPGKVKVELKHPDGTWITLWDPDHVADATTTGDFLGQGSASDSDLCFLADRGAPLYGTTLSPVGYPRVGQFFAVDGPPSALFAGKSAAGTFQLRITRPAGTATLHYASLRFELPEPAYGRLNTFDKPDTDDPAIAATFHSGFGKANAKQCQLAEEGGALVNEAIEVPQGENPDPIVRQNGSSRDETGTWQSCESSGQDDTPTVLQAKADATVKAYGRPPIVPDAFAPADDTGQPNLPRPLFDYKPGGHIKVEAERGLCAHALVARVTKLTLTQLAGGVSCQPELIPTESSTSELSDGGSA